MSKIQDLRTWMVLNELFMRKNTKLQIVVFFFKKKGENVQEENEDAEIRFCNFLEREREPSL